MKKEKKCPVCGGTEKQHKQGFTTRYTALQMPALRKKYTLEPKRHAYSDEIREQALKTYFSGVSGRGVGNIFGMSKANVYN
ncbi:MAG: hypothetical protein LBM98_03365 [Oscillospiraceae bacterium]|jgi:transposase-like protein|nr:hypothetical protein [Oscillospiraceae bacterium]